MKTVIKWINENITAEELKNELMDKISSLPDEFEKEEYVFKKIESLEA